MTPELSAVVEEAYTVFSRYRIEGRTITVCPCPSCVSEENRAALIRTPLREISSALLSEYTSSAHEWDDGPVAREMRYLLPRYLELIAWGAIPGFDLDICLSRLSKSGWRSKWPDREIDLLDRFLDALVDDRARVIELAHWPIGWRLRSDVEGVLALTVTAGGDLGRVLARLDRVPDPEAALHLASLREEIAFETTRIYLRSSFLEKHRAEADRIGAFLMRTEVSQRIEASFFTVDDPRLQQILSDALTA